MIPLPPVRRPAEPVHRPGEPSTDNTTWAWRMTGPLDRAALAAAIGDVVARHHGLRTVPAAGFPLDVPVRELVERDVTRALQDAAQHRFGAADEIPVRAQVLACAPGVHVLVLVLRLGPSDGELQEPPAAAGQARRRAVRGVRSRNAPGRSTPPRGGTGCGGFSPCLLPRFAGEQ